MDFVRMCENINYVFKKYKHVDDIMTSECGFQIIDDMVSAMGCRLTIDLEDIEEHTVDDYKQALYELRDAQKAYMDVRGDETISQEQKESFGKQVAIKAEAADVLLGDI